MASPPGTRASDSAPSPWRGLRPWVVASVLVHALWLAPSPGSRLSLPPSQGGPLKVRWLAAPPIAESNAPQAPPSPLRPPGVAMQTAPVRPAAVPAIPESSAAPSPAWPPNGRWRYALQWRGEQGEAVIDWQQDGVQYRLRLERQAGSRTLPPWESEGRMDGDGLQPARFTAGRTGREHTAWRFSSGQLLPQRGDLQAAPAGTQDRLSWMWQLAWQAARLKPQPGHRLHVVVAGWRGPPQAWDMQTEPDPDRPQWLLLRRVLPEGSLSEQRLWLDPTMGYLPVRLEMRYDDAERWSLALQDVPPVAAKAPSSP